MTDIHDVCHNFIPTSLLQIFQSVNVTIFFGYLTQRHLVPIKCYSLWVDSIGVSSYFVLSQRGKFTGVQPIIYRHLLIIQV